MQPSSVSSPGHGQKLADAIRAVRARYDALERGQVAQLRRCRTAGELVLEPVYWRVAGDAPKTVTNLPHVVLLFPFAGHRSNAKFSFGWFLHERLGDQAGAALRFRRMISVESRDELDHRLRAILRLTAASGVPVDWGILGRDLLWFFAESDATRRRWAQDFYAPMLRETATDSNDPPPTT